MPADLTEGDLLDLAGLEHPSVIGLLATELLAARARIAALEAVQRPPLASVLDRVTDLFERWAAEESEHRAAGEYGIAEGLHVAIDGLRDAVRGGEVQCPSAELVKLRRLLAEFVDPDDDSVCRFDHHGACQEHGLHSLEPGKLCPYIEARQYLAGIQEVQP